MAGTLGKLLVSLGLDTSEYKKGLDDASGSTNSFVSSVASGLGHLAFGAAIAGVAALGTGLYAAVGNAMEAQDVMAQTEAVIKSTGGAAGMSAKQMGDLATSLSAASGLSKYGDEAILSGENLLATFTNIGSKTFPLATKAMVDMATAMKTDVAGGAIQLGKALNDPEKGITALTRVGVTFTQAQKDVIKHLQDTGDMAGAQLVILKELDKEFGGSAAAAAATFSGKIATLKDKFGELLEGVGTQLLPMLGQFVDILNSPQVQSGIQAIADGIVSGIGVAVNWLVTTGIPSVVAGWGLLTTAFNTTMVYIQPVIDAFTALGNYLLNVWQDGDVLNQYLTGLPTLLQPIVVIIGDYVNVLGDYFDTIVNVGTALLNGDFMGALTALETGLSGVASDMLTYYTDIGTTLLALGTYIVTQAMTWGTALVNWITPYIPVAIAYLNNLIIQIQAWAIAQVPIIEAAVLQWGNALVEWVTPYIPIALTYLQTLIIAVGGWITAQATVLQGYFMTWATAGGDWVTPYITIVLTYLQGLISAVGAWIGAQPGILTAQFTTWAVATYNWIPGAIVQFLTVWPSMLNSFLDWIAKGAGPVLAAFVSWIVPLIPGIVQALGGLALAMVAFIGETATVLTVKLVEWGIAMISWVAKQVLPQLPSALSMVTSLIMNWISVQVGPINTNILQWVMAFTSWVQSGVQPALTTALNALGQMILAWINAAAGTAGSEAIKIGTQLIQGIIKGLGDGSSLNDAVQNIISNALGMARTDNKIHSPSQVWADELGEPMILGLVEGMNATMPQVLQWVKGNLGKKLSGYLTNAAAMVRGNLDIFTSLHDLEQINPFQPLVDSTKALTDAQKSSVDVSGKLFDINDRIMAIQAQSAASSDVALHVKNNQELTSLYQQQAQLLQDQAVSQANLVSLAQDQAKQQNIATQQQNDVNQIAAQAQQQYNDLATQSQAMMGVDAKRALDFFNMRKSQIQELADLEKQRALATSTDDQKFLDTQIALTKAAQSADTAAAQATVNVNVPGGTYDVGTQRILDIINQALKAAGLQTDVRVRTT